MVRSVINVYPLRPLDSLEIIVVPSYLGTTKSNPMFLGLGNQIVCVNL